MTRPKPRPLTRSFRRWARENPEIVQPVAIATAAISIGALIAFALSRAPN